MNPLKLLIPLLIAYTNLNAADPKDVKIAGYYLKSKGEMIVLEDKTIYSMQIFPDKNKGFEEYHLQFIQKNDGSITTRYIRSERMDGWFHTTVTEDVGADGKADLQRIVHQTMDEKDCMKCSDTAIENNTVWVGLPNAHNQEKYDSAINNFILENMSR